ncbi:MAG: NIPSNAP family protein [Chitinophagaceae bacterium]
MVRQLYESVSYRFGLLIGVFLMVSLVAFSYPPAKEFYEIRIYHLKDKAQEDRVDQFLQTAFLPALHKNGIKKVGVFKPVGNDTAADRRIFVLIPFNSLQQVTSIGQRLEKDPAFTSAGKDYFEAPFNNPPYTRIETIHLEAFPDMPQMQLPALKGPKSERVYELRSYESATENLHISKVKMFNEGGEIRIFKKLGFNAVFYARAISGSYMPNLMYMTTFENKAVRDEHWKAFFADPEFVKLAAMPEYKNTVSKNVTMFLEPVDYSDY